MGNTPIAKARNLGPQTAIELDAVGINTREELIEVGWEEAFARVAELFPKRLHLTMAYALIGAIEDLDWRSIPPDLQARAKKLVAAMRRARQ